MKSTLVNKRNTAPVSEMIPIIKAAIEKGKPVEMTVTGRSMLPLLRDRVSVVRLVRPDDLQAGDIVLFERNDGHYVLHRIIHIHNDHNSGALYDIVGDNQYVPDRDVAAEAIIAKVAAYSRDGRLWKELADNDGLYLKLLPLLRTTKYYGRRVTSKIRRELASLVKRSL